MHTIRKRIVTDEHHEPVAVQIAYEDWLEIERRLGLSDTATTNLSAYAGTIHLTEDPLEYQRRARRVELECVLDTNVVLYLLGGRLGEPLP